MRRPKWECSSRKSSAKFGFLTFVPSNSIFVEHCDNPLIFNVTLHEMNRNRSSLLDWNLASVAEPYLLLRPMDICYFRPLPNSRVGGDPGRSAESAADGRCSTLLESLPLRQTFDPVLSAYTGIPAMCTVGDRISPARLAKMLASDRTQSEDYPTPTRC